MLALTVGIIASMDDATRGGRLIFDLGMNDGDDALRNLRRGFRVVAVEANPDNANMVEGKGCPRQPHAARTNQHDLVVVNRAVAQAANATLSFCIHPRSISSQVMTSGQRCAGIPTAVATITCAELVRRFGRPWTIKIDVEGQEDACIQSLLTLPRRLLPEYIEYESPLRAPTRHRRCDASCVSQFLRTVDAMAARGYVDWKRQWWRAQGSERLLPTEVKDKGERDPQVWVNTSEVLADGCGFFKVADALTIPPRVVRRIRQSTGCDLHARLFRRNLGTASFAGGESLAARLLKQRPGNATRGWKFKTLCGGGAAMLIA